MKQQTVQITGEVQCAQAKLQIIGKVHRKQTQGNNPFKKHTEMYIEDTWIIQTTFLKLHQAASEKGLKDHTAYQIYNVSIQTNST